MISLIKEKHATTFDFLPKESGKLYSFLNPYSYNIARKHKAIYKEIDVLFFDGIGMVYPLRFFSFCRLHIKRVSFDMTSLAPIVFDYSIKNNKSVYLIGTKQELIEKAVEHIKENFPDLNILGYRNGYMSKESYAETLTDITQLNPDIVIAGMGALLQEKFLVDLRHQGWKGTGFTCGGFFHQTSKRLIYYPTLMNWLNLRWLYRIYDEPKRLKLYTIDYIKFLFLFLYDLIVFKYKGLNFKQ